MPQDSTNYNLKLYDRISDNGQKFIDFRDNIAGTSPESNMNKIDKALKDNADFIDNLAGANRTTETVKNNSDNIVSLKEKVSYVVGATVSSDNTYVATHSEIATYKNNLLIQLTVPQSNTGSATLNINNLGAKTLTKIDNNGNANNISAGDLRANRPYLFKYNGSIFIAIGLGSADQINITDAGNKITATNVEDALQESFNQMGVLANDVTALQSEVLNNLNTASLSLSTADSIKSVNANVASVPKVKIVAPDMLVNLLGKDGDFEDLSKWSWAIKQPTLDTSKKMFGNASFRYVKNNENGYIYKDLTNIGLDKYYILSLWVNVEVALSGAHTIVLYDYKSFNNPAILGSLVTLTADKSLNTWFRVGIKFKSVKESPRLMLFGGGDGIGTYNFDGIMPQEITADEYNNLTVDQLLAKYPYVNGVQPLLNPCLTVMGKNLVDKSKVTDNVTFETSGGKAVSYNGYTVSDFIQILPGMSVTHNGIHRFQWFDKNKQWLSRSNAGADGKNTQIAPSNVYYFRTETDKAIRSIDTWQIEYGATITAYEPYREKQRIYPCTLGKVSTYADELTDDGIKAVKTWRVKKYVLQASNISSLNTGEANVDYVLLTSEFFKKIGGNIALPTESKAIVGDYIGVGYSTGTWNTLTNPHHFSISGADGRMAFIFPKGTYANLAAAQAALTGTEIWYVLAQEEQEIIEPIGSLKLEQGYNCIDVSTGIVYERANPILAGGNYAINKISEAASILKYKTNNILALLKNKIPDNNWIIGANSVNYYGGGYAYIPEAKYDLTATYTVLYEVLHEEYNSQQVSVILEYADNLRTSHNQLVENVAGLESEVNDVWFSLLILADKEIGMRMISLLTTETTVDLKNKINEILNVWR